MRREREEEEEEIERGGSTGVLFLLFLANFFLQNNGTLFVYSFQDFTLHYIHFTLTTSDHGFHQISRWGTRPTDDRNYHSAR